MFHLLIKHMSYILMVESCVKKLVSVITHIIEQSRSHFTGKKHKHLRPEDFPVLENLTVTKC